MDHKRIFLLLIACGLFIIPSIIQAETFVNWRAKYYINYPDDWYQVSYGTVNFFLTTQDIDPNKFEYDAVLAKSDDEPFFNVPYVFLHFQQVGELNNKQIDSVLEDLSDEYSNPYTRESLKDANRRFSLSHPIYDKSLKAVAIKSRITTEITDKYLLEIRKFFPEGVAVFLCYSPTEMYEEAKPVFLGILHSFSIENLDSAASKDSFKIVDLSDREALTYDAADFPDPNSEEGMSDQSRRIIYILILAVIVIGVLGIIFKKRIKK
jgi:hypothetical protein